MLGAQTLNFCPSTASDKTKTRKFDTEAQLLSAFEHTLSSMLGQDKHELVLEFDCGNGIADAVIIEYNSNKNHLVPLANISGQWLYALSQLPKNEEFSCTDLRSFLGVSESTTRKVIQEFAASGYCVEGNDKGLWKKIRQPRKLAKNIVAIEAKLSNWQRALKQAIRYKEFANESWVLMDEASLAPAISNLNRFSHFNIGLASINTAGRILTHLAPHQSSPVSQIKHWRANSIVARHRIEPLL